MRTNRPGENYLKEMDVVFYKLASWNLSFAWLPKRCDKSNKRIWLRRAYKGTAMYTGPGTPVFEHKWIDHKMFLLYRIKGEV